MDNPETLTTLVILDTERRQIKQSKTTTKQSKTTTKQATNQIKKQNKTHHNTTNKQI